MSYATLAAICGAARFVRRDTFLSAFDSSNIAPLATAAMAVDKAADGGPPIPDWAAATRRRRRPSCSVIKDGVPVDEILLTAARCPWVGRPDAGAAARRPSVGARLLAVDGRFVVCGRLRVVARVTAEQARCQLCCGSRDGDVLQFGHLLGSSRYIREDGSAEQHCWIRRPWTRPPPNTMPRGRCARSTRRRSSSTLQKKVTAADLHATTWGQDDDAAPEKDDEALPDYLKKDRFMEYGER